jgi:hypothetical protein
MAKEKFLIVASQCHDDCFSRFSETANREAIEAGTANPEDAYSWIEASFEIRLIRWREATHICSFTPSAYYVWLQNYFVGFPNAKWDYDGDPEGLERENGGEWHGYATYRDDYDSRFICAEFTIDTMRDLESPMRKPSHKRRAMTTGDHGEAVERYNAAIWKRAEEIAHEMDCNGGLDGAPILNGWTFRQWERERLEKARQCALEDSKRRYRYSWPNDLLAPAYEAQARAARPDLFAE